MDGLPVFRSSKKRRFARNRNTANDGEDEQLELPDQEATPESVGGAEVAISQVFRLRKQYKARGGVQFSNSRPSDPNEAEFDIDAEAVVDEDSERLKVISGRFVGSTGQVVDVDKHMMAYIDSEIAKRHTTTTTNKPPLEYDDDDYTSSDSDTSPPPRNTNSKPTKLPYETPKPLSEFDLGSLAQTTNIARTSAAIARVQSGLPIVPDEPIRKIRRPPRKPRLGRDGKPLRPRPRKRRNSSDVARDALVEQILHEHSLGTSIASAIATSASANPDAQSRATNGDTGADTDEMLAEQFRQEFLDAAAERRQRHQSKAASKGKDVASAVASGPRLGGSRSARAKMHAAMQAQKDGGGAAEKR